MARCWFCVSPNSESRRSEITLRTNTLILLSLLLLIAPAAAQFDPAVGILPFSTQAGGQYDSIDLASGNIRVDFRVRDKIGKIPFSYDLGMNSHMGFYAQTGYNALLLSSGLSGQLRAGGASIFLVNQPSSEACPPQGQVYFGILTSAIYVTDSTGAMHSATGGSCPFLLRTLCRAIRPPFPKHRRTNAPGGQT